MINKPAHRAPNFPGLRDQNVLHVVCVISNPCRYGSRYRLYEEFAARMEKVPEVHLVTVEHAFGERRHEVTSADRPDHVQVRGRHELWHKENLINVGARSLPRDWRYLAWIDADLTFANRDWAQETLHQLQHYQVVQLFEDAIDMGPRNNVVKHHMGFVRQYRSGAMPVHRAGEGGGYGKPGGGAFWHPGFAWACQRRWWENVGGLIDFAILGAADHHMALGMIGRIGDSMPKCGLHPAYVARCKEWERRCTKALNGDLGYVEGTIFHSWHGPKSKRFYGERWQILKDHGYNPDTDLSYDAQGLLCLAGNKPGLRDGIRGYFRSRDEDSLSED